MKSARWLVGLLGTTALVALVGGRATAGAIPSWYRPRLRKPHWTPPEQAFGPVWTVLYVSMAISAWLVVRAADPESRARTVQVRVALGAWLIQLGLNLAWSLVFFGRRSVGGGVAVIAGLWLAIVATLVIFGRISSLAAVLLVPYLVWTTFAGALNVRIWQLQRKQCRRSWDSPRRRSRSAPVAAMKFPSGGHEISPDGDRQLVG